MNVCCECCVLSGRGLCDELTTRPDESYRLWCVVVWSRNLVNEEALAHWGLSRQKKRKERYRPHILNFGTRWWWVVCCISWQPYRLERAPDTHWIGCRWGPIDSLDALGKTKAVACARKRTQSSRPPIPYPLRDFRLPPWSVWELRSSGLLHSV